MKPWSMWAYINIGERIFTICLAVLTEYRGVTD